MNTCEPAQAELEVLRDAIGAPAAPMQPKKRAVSALDVHGCIYLALNTDVSSSAVVDLRARHVRLCCWRMLVLLT